MTNDDGSLELGPGGGPAPSSPRRRGTPILAYLLIGLASLAVGVGGTLLMLRSRIQAAPAVSGAAPPASQVTGHEGMPGMGDSAEADRPAGASEKAVHVSAARQQLIGVRTAVVGQRELAATIRTTGTLAYDETRLTEVHTKITGWVERVFVDYVGKAVRRNTPLFTVYSPDLVATQNEYLLALRNRERLSDSRVSTARTAAEDLLSAAHDRLKLWDIAEEDILALGRTGEVRKTLTLHAPFDGVVLERTVFPGQYITPEMAAFKIADLSHIWAIGTVFENEIARIRVGQEAEVQFPNGEATRSLKGRISFIYPEIDPQTRRVRVRAELANPGLQLRPETYVTVLIHAGGSHSLAIPKEAVIDTGTKQYAMLALANGYFEPREIQVGPSSDEFYPLLGGLEEGDRIVTSAQFLIDSETNLKAAMQSMAGMPGMTPKGGEGSKGTGEAESGGDMKGMDMPAAKPAVPAPPPSPPHQGHQG